MVVLTALEPEYEAVRRLLTDPRPVPHRAGTLFEVGTLPDCPWNVAIAIHGEGNHTAAIMAERAIARFSPKTVLFVGVAGALHEDLSLGDLVIATRVYSYHGGKEVGGRLHERPRAWEAPHHLEQLARHVARSRGWLELLTGTNHPLSTSVVPEPAVYFRPIAAGETVLAARNGSQRKRIRRNYNDAAAVDMEGAGVARAAQLNGSLPTLIIRGISDLADAGKEELDRAGWQRLAAANAAAFAVSLINQLPEKTTR